MKAWHYFAIAGFACLVTAQVAYYREMTASVPSWAGRLCDEVWNRTREGDPTVRWYHACIKEASKEYAKHHALAAGARSDETPTAAQSEGRQSGGEAVTPKPEAEGQHP